MEDCFHYETQTASWAASLKTFGSTASTDGSPGSLSILGSISPSATSSPFRKGTNPLSHSKYYQWDGSHPSQVLDAICSSFVVDGSCYFQEDYAVAHGYGGSFEHTISVIHASVPQATGTLTLDEEGCGTFFQDFPLLPTS